VTPYNRVFADPTIAHAWSPWTAAGRAALDSVVTNQATIIGYMDDFKLLMLMSLIAIPLVLLLRKSTQQGGVDHSVAME
jgi:DHA2 family multidrug resistance protein